VCTQLDPECQGCGETESCEEITGCLVVSGCDCPEILEPTETALDQVAGAIEGLIEGEKRLAIGLVGDDRGCPATVEKVPQMIGVIGFVSDQMLAGCGRGQQGRGAFDIGDLSAGEQKGIGPHLVIDQSMNFGGSATARAANGLMPLSTVCAAGGAMGSHSGAVDHAQGRRVLKGGQRGQDPLPDAALAPAIEAIVDRRVRPIDGRQRSPSAPFAKAIENAADDPLVVLAFGAGMKHGKTRLKDRHLLIAEPENTRQTSSRSKIRRRLMRRVDMIDRWAAYYKLYRVELDCTVLIAGCLGFRKGAEASPN
jgi:hypothetical protein